MHYRYLIFNINILISKRDIFLFTSSKFIASVNRKHMQLDKLAYVLCVKIIYAKQLTLITDFTSKRMQGHPFFNTDFHFYDQMHHMNTCESNFANGNLILITLCNLFRFSDQFSP